MATYSVAIPLASTSVDGLMAAADKIKLASAIVVSSASGNLATSATKLFVGTQANWNSISDKSKLLAIITG